MGTVNLADSHPSDLPELLERRNKTAVGLHDHSFLELSYILRILAEDGEDAMYEYVRYVYLGKR